jgi:hypothetical protein
VTVICQLVSVSQNPDWILDTNFWFLFFYFIFPGLLISCKIQVLFVILFQFHGLGIECIECPNEEKSELVPKPVPYS